VFYKARIGSRKPKAKIKRCWNWACTLKRPSVRLSVQGPVATSGCTLGARLGAHLSIQSAVLHSNFRVLPLFHSKSPILISQHPNMFTKIVYRFMNTKRAFKNTSNMKSNVISTQFTNSTHFYKTLNNNSIHTTNPKLWTPKVWIINNNTS